MGVATKQAHGCDEFQNLVPSQTYGCLSMEWLELQNFRAVIVATIRTTGFGCHQFSVESRWSLKDVSLLLTLRLAKTATLLARVDRRRLY